MTRQEAVALCRYVKACCPQQAMDEYTPDAWHDLLGGLDAGDCRKAARAVAQRQPFVSPSEISEEVRRMRTERIGPAGPGLGPTPPPADPDDTAAYLAALRTQQAQVAAGRLPREAPALPAGKDRAAYDTPAVRNLRARFEAAQEAARRRKAEEAAAEKTALAAYLDAVKVLCNLDDPDQVAAVVDQARDELLSDEQAALGFPLLAMTPGVTDEHRITIHAAGIARRAESEAS